MLLYKLKWKLSSYEKRAEYLRRKGMKVGKHCEIYSDVDFGSEPYLISIGDYVRICSGVRFVTHDGGVWVLRNMNMLKNADVFGEIKIGSNVHIGMNAIIMPGLTIGNNCIIGCGAIVTKDIPDNSVAAGVPAKVIKTIFQYYEKQKDNSDFTKHMNSEQKKQYLYKKYKLSK